MADQRIVFGEAREAREVLSSLLSSTERDSTMKPNRRSLYEFWRDIRDDLDYWIDGLGQFIEAVFLVLFWLVVACLAAGMYLGLLWLGRWITLAGTVFIVIVGLVYHERRYGSGMGSSMG